MMKMKDYLFLSALTVSFLPAIAFADISVKNNTDAYATAKAGFTCSSIAGDHGVIKPHSPLVIPQDIINMYCNKTCNVDVFISKSCGGHAIATVSVDQHKGITGVKNHNIDDYLVSGNGDSGFIDGGPAKKWYNFLF